MEVKYYCEKKEEKNDHVQIQTFVIKITLIRLT